MGARGQGICLIIAKYLPILSDFMAQKAFRKREAIDESKIEREEGRKEEMNNLFHSYLLSA